MIQCISRDFLTGRPIPSLWSTRDKVGRPAKTLLKEIMLQRRVYLVAQAPLRTRTFTKTSIIWTQLRTHKLIKISRSNLAAALQSRTWASVTIRASPGNSHASGVNSLPVGRALKTWGVRTERYRCTPKDRALCKMLVVPVHPGLHNKTRKASDLHDRSRKHKKRCGPSLILISEIPSGKTWRWIITTSLMAASWPNWKNNKVDAPSSLKSERNHSIDLLEVHLMTNSGRQTSNSVDTDLWMQRIITIKCKCKVMRYRLTRKRPAFPVGFSRSWRRRARLSLQECTRPPKRSRWGLSNPKPY